MYPTELKICEQFILDHIQPLLEKSNDQNQFAYKKARNIFDAMGILEHTIAKSLGDVSKLHKAVFCGL